MARRKRSAVASKQNAQKRMCSEQQTVNRTENETNSTAPGSADSQEKLNQRFSTIENSINKLRTENVHDNEVNGDSPNYVVVDIGALMQLSRDKIFDYLIKFAIKVPTPHLKCIKDSHKLSVTIDLDTIKKEDGK
ncbi:hypothetical protein JTE90_029265 [Oedothorax gibbosus]|uniref:Uncharacterized protein n=1 Tax=Oedothorax gibbosus TaxID=931172 RepID=A0AAV6TVU6_9ARAC|nr:hypothetical protein JTE90_029265 [Oedothorax gibbosus]